ncbi:hypothetical protein PN419_00395 [Halorubrum ezzemoulense]|uniref:phage tail fiber protein n=1 Tax=Halorubrum ezzemoulense TaxID=337243 RepID=UPI0023302D8D|nr:hypothetical protein [Halorubrum ezzemoulense]MDB9247466.1 hypothetical protein [Halorubrum ezzemoulense]MDB9258625.1 hypothetical protein [Halorubrum ezzemoulense]MDB9264517.1 hypothetical protein [Halorubrum ezzemoulense]MDB9268986.1 hypothetical protein [Halorubrum ezzemoulense]MDB9271485.1 hypothetical protein [Halorubrum ezzemoulense]
MSNDKTQYLEQQTLDRIFDNVAPDGALDGVYVALWASSPANSPDPVNEVSGNEYSPVQVTASNWSLDNAGGPRRYVNDNIIDFGKLDTGSSKTVTGVVLYDGADTSTANALYADDLVDGSTTVEAGNKFEIEGGNLPVEED